MKLIKEVYSPLSRRLGFVILGLLAFFGTLELGYAINQSSNTFRTENLIVDTKSAIGSLYGTSQLDSSTGTIQDFVINDNVTVLRWTGASGVAYGGFKCGIRDCDARDDNRLLLVDNVVNGSGSILVLVSASASASNTNNQIITAGNASWALRAANQISPVGSASALLRYDGTSLKWRVGPLITDRFNTAIEFASSIAVDVAITLGSGGFVNSGPFTMNAARHMATTGTQVIPTGCGSSPAVRGTDIAGRITIGSGGTGCTVPFGLIYLTDIPSCGVWFEGAGTGTFQQTNSQIVVVAAAGTSFDWHCWALSP